MFQGFRLNLLKTFEVSNILEAAGKIIGLSLKSNHQIKLSPSKSCNELLWMKVKIWVFLDLPTPDPSSQSGRFWRAKRSLSTTATTWRARKFQDGSKNFITKHFQTKVVNKHLFHLNWLTQMWIMKWKFEIRMRQNVFKFVELFEHLKKTWFIV